MEAARDMGSSFGTILFAVAVICIIIVVVKKIKNK